MEAKFVAFSTSIQEVLWMKCFLDHLGVNANSANLVLVKSDSQAMIAYIKDPKYHYKTKHINTKYNFVENMVARKDENMKYISMHEMVVDPLIKPIP